MATTPRRLPSGNWNTVVRLPNGKRKSITRPLKGEVVAAARELETRVARGDLSSVDRKTTVQAWHDRWILGRHVERSTEYVHNYALARHVLPYWGGWPLASIGRMDVQTWVGKMTRDGVGPHAVIRAYSLLSLMLADAELERLISASPCRRIELPKTSSPEPRWLTRHEYDRLLLAFDSVPNGDVWRAMVGVGCFTGMRPGELAGLDVGQIDFERALIRVGQVVTQQGLRAYPKTEGSRRSVPFPPEVGEMLWRVVADKSETDPAFPTVTGKRLNLGNWLNLVWRPALERAGIPYVRAYVMRHTACSWLVQAGVPDRKIMKILGHTTPKLISLYGHLAPDAHDEVRAAWAAGAQVTNADAAAQSLSEERAGQGAVSH